MKKKTKKKKKLTAEEKKQIRIRENARLAKMLLPKPVKAFPYTKTYLESYKHKLFWACQKSRHRKCPQTSDMHHEHLYCSCPCHRLDLKPAQKRALITKQIQDLKNGKIKTRRGKKVTVPGAAKVKRGKGATVQYFHVGADPSKPTQCSQCGKVWKTGRKTRFDSQGAYCGTGCQNKYKANHPTPVAVKNHSPTGAVRTA
jgi:hypothetical protein